MRLSFIGYKEKRKI